MSPLYRPTAPGCLAGICLIAHCAVSAEHSADDVEWTRKLGQPFYSGHILPTPKNAEYKDDTIPLADGVAGRIQCSTEFEYSGPTRPLLERLFTKRFRAYGQLFGETALRQDKETSVRVIFTLASNGNVSALLDRFGLRGKAASLQPQGYLLDIRTDGILCVGKDDQGLVNALASLLQLVHVKDGKLVARCAHVVDFPTFTTRYTSDYFPLGTNFYEWMALNKINGFSCGYANYFKWTGLEPQQENALAQIRQFTADYQVMSFLPQIHIGGRRPDFAPAIDAGDAKQVQTLLATIEKIMELSGARSVLLLWDDVKSVLPGEKAREQFKTLGQASGYVADCVYKRMQELYPGSTLIFCPPHYQGLKHRRWQGELGVEARQYMRDVRSWNRNIVLAWTGPVTESRTIADQDIMLYKALMNEDRRLFYWDNTWHYHQPLRNFHAQYPQDFVEHCVDRTAYININARLPIGKFFSVTAMDYYWNPVAFEARRSWREAVAQFMGEAAVPVAERFYAFRGDGYYYHFSRGADIPAFRGILTDLEAASMEKGIVDYCWYIYNQICKIQGKDSLTHE